MWTGAGETREPLGQRKWQPEVSQKAGERREWEAALLGLCLVHKSKQEEGWRWALQWALQQSEGGASLAFHLAVGKVELV